MGSPGVSPRPSPNSAVGLAPRYRPTPVAAYAIMGVVNVTPDSFSDGGALPDAAAAVAHARRLVEEGAAIVDVGGESTRPGAGPVPADEELRRVASSGRGARPVRGAKRKRPPSRQGEERDGGRGVKSYQTEPPSPWGMGRGSSRTTGTVYECVSGRR